MLKGLSNLCYALFKKDEANFLFQYKTQFPQRLCSKFKDFSGIFGKMVKFWGFKSTNQTDSSFSNLQGPFKNFSEFSDFAKFLLIDVLKFCLPCNPLDASYFILLHITVSANTSGYENVCLVKTPCSAAIGNALNKQDQNAIMT